MARAAVVTQNSAVAGAFSATVPTVSATSWWMSLHTADPGTTGSSEYPGVTRLQFPAGAPSAGAVSNTAAMSFTTDGTTLVTHIGIWSAVTGGTYRIGAALTSPVTAATINFAIGQASFTDS